MQQQLRQQRLQWLLRMLRQLRQHCMLRLQQQRLMPSTMRLRQLSRAASLLRNACAVDERAPPPVFGGWDRFV